MSKPRQSKPGESASRRWRSGAVGMLGLTLLVVLGLVAGRELARAPIPDEVPEPAPEQSAGTRAGDDSLPQRRVAGVVSSELGPVAGASVTLRQLDVQGPAASQKVMTDFEGRFVWPGIPDGRLRLEVSADGFESAFATDDAITAETAITLSSGTRLVGRTTVAEKGVEAEVTLTAVGLFPPIRVTADSNGQFRTAPLAPRRYHLDVRYLDGDRAYGLNDVIEHGDAGEPPAMTLELEARPIVLVQVSDSAELPVDGAVVTITDSPLHLGAKAQVTSQGAVVVYGVQPGDRWVRVRAAGYVEHSRPISIDPATDSPQVVVVPMVKTGTISGVVLGPIGNPRPLVQVVADVITGEGGAWTINRDETLSLSRLVRPKGDVPVSFSSAFGFFSDDQGRFTITGLPPGITHLRVVEPGFQEAKVGPLSVDANGVVEDVVVRLEPGFALRGRVLGPDDELIAGATVETQTGETQAPDVPLAGAESRAVRTTDDGHFAATDLPPPVTYRVSAPGYVAARGFIELESGVESLLEVRLQSARGAVRGRVRDAAGADVVGAVVRLADGETESCVGTTGDDGLFVMEGCPEKAFELEVDAGEALVQRFEVVPDTNPELALRPAFDIALKVVDADGEPLHNVRPQLRAVTVEGIAPEAILTAETGEDGRGVLVGALAGRWQLSVRLEGFAEQQVDLDVSDAEREPIVVTMRPVQRQQGAVVDRYGAAVGRAFVTIRVGDGPPEHVRSDSAGAFHFVHEEESDVVLTAVHPKLGSGTTSGTIPSDDDLIVALDNETADVSDLAEALEEAGVEVWVDELSVVVSAVEEGSAAHDAGLRRDDILIGAREAGGNILLDYIRGSIRGTASWSAP